MADTEAAIDELNERMRNANRAERRALLRQRLGLYEELERRSRAVDDAQRAILGAAYGSDYGFWQRNGIDFRHTPSFLLGIVEGAPGGMWQAVVDTAELLAMASPGGMAIRAMAPREPAPPPPTAAEERQRRMDERTRVLEAELERIHDPAGFNRRMGRIGGREIIGPVVVGEAGMLAVTALGRGAAATRTVANGTGTGVAAGSRVVIIDDLVARGLTRPQAEPNRRPSRHHAAGRT